MVKKIYFAQCKGIDKYLFGCFYSDIETGRITKFVGYSLECGRKVWNIQKHVGDVFQFLEEGEIEKLLTCSVWRISEQEFKKAAKCYSSVQRRIKYFVKTHKNRTNHIRTNNNFF